MYCCPLAQTVCGALQGFFPVEGEIDDPCQVFFGAILFVYICFLPFSWLSLLSASHTNGLLSHPLAVVFAISRRKSSHPTQFNLWSALPYGTPTWVVNFYCFQLLLHKETFSCAFHFA